MKKGKKKTNVSAFIRNVLLGYCELIRRRKAVRCQKTYQSGLSMGCHAISYSYNREALIGLTGILRINAWNAHAALEVAEADNYFLIECASDATMWLGIIEKLANIATMRTDAEAADEYLRTMCCNSIPKSA